MRIFKTKEFSKIAAKDLEISDEALKKAIKEMCNGLCEVNLGGNVYKKRIALNGRGKSGGARTILCFKEGEKAFFIYAFSKNDKDNISNIQKEYIKVLADHYLRLTEESINNNLKKGNLLEIK